MSLLKFGTLLRLQALVALILGTVSCTPVWNTQQPGTQTLGLTSTPKQDPVRTPASPEVEITVTVQLPAVTEEIPMGERTVTIPSQEDWVDQGIILEAGDNGEWDYYLWGGFAFSVIKFNDIFYLYYQGSRDYQTGENETVLWRAIGVATSNDGKHFAKYEGNPILTWFPNNHGEEGAVSSGVTFGEDGNLVLFYGANTQESKTTVNADGRIAVSADGFAFTDVGVAINYRSSSVWGSGDEIFPVDVIYDQGKWVVFYIPNGTAQSGLLGVAHGSAMDALQDTSPVLSNGKEISVWGTMSHVKIRPDQYALVLNNVREKRTDVRLLSLDTPNNLSEIVAVYQFSEVQQLSLLFDEEQNTWFMYYRTYDNKYGLKTAKNAP